VRSLVGHVFAAEERRIGAVIRSIGLVRATVRITLASLSYNMHRLADRGDSCVRLTSNRPRESPRPAIQHRPAQ
jgi:hypothetical protein